MQEGQFADLELKTIVALTGMPVKKDIVNPKQPHEMATRVKVTFRPLPDSYRNMIVKDFRQQLEDKLRENGVQVIPWEEASDASKGIMAKLIAPRKVRSSIHAVIDVKREYSTFRKVMSGVAETIYGWMRKPERSVMDILKISGWADDFTARYVQDPFNTQIITLMPLDPEFAAESTSYDRKIAIGLSNLISTMSEIVMGVAPDKFSLINMNLSDSIFKKEEIDSFILNSLIPKIYAPIKPPVLNRFKQSEYSPEESVYVEQLTNLGKQARDTELFPHGSKFSEKVSRLSHRDVVERILEGRTGVSYGFIALAEAPIYEGKKKLKKADWASLKEIDGLSNEYVRESDDGRWYVKTKINKKETYQQVPDIWIVTSRSGCDKTNLDPNRDIVRIGLIKGKLQLQTPKGIDLARRDIRPSFDTFVILAQAMATALYTPALIKDGLPILHFHGYPDPSWFGNSEYFAGAKNPSLPCGTVEAALLNYNAIFEVANQNGTSIKMLCLVESDHGVNILGMDRDYVVDRLKQGVQEGHVLLGGTYLPALKKDNGNADTAAATGN